MFAEHAQVTLAGSDFDTLLAVYTGKDLATLFRVAYNDDCGGMHSCLAFTPTPCEDYWLQVDGYGGARGTVRINVERVRQSTSPSPSSSPAPSPLSPPPNDAFAKASAPLPGFGTTVSATLEPGEPLASVGASGRSIWYLWIAVCDSLSALMSVRARVVQALQRISAHCILSALMMTHMSHSIVMSDLWFALLCFALLSSHFPRLITTADQSC
jgi:hypothetical protein